MISVKGYRCPNCGKMLSLTNRQNILRCDACESEYRVDDDNDIFSTRPLRIERIDYDTKILEGKVSLPMSYLRYNPEHTTGIVESMINSLAEDMAKNLIPYLQIENEVDIRRLEYNISARLRVHVPSRPLEEQLKSAIPEYARAVEARRFEDEKY